MCGIFGIVNIKPISPFEQSLSKYLLLTIQHRGADAITIKVFENRAILGNVQLSIIYFQEKTNKSFQVDNRYCIVFIGEIYNYIEELRDELIVAGYHFDTEV